MSKSALRKRQVLSDQEAIAGNYNYILLNKHALPVDYIAIQLLLQTVDPLLTHLPVRLLLKHLRVNCASDTNRTTNYIIAIVGGLTNA